MSRSISIDKVKDAVRALGWFPTELQIEELLTEIKFSKYHKTQEQTTMVDLDDFIKLYLNHRPVQRMGLEEIDHAFSTLAEGGTLSRDELVHALEVIINDYLIDRLTFSYLTTLSSPRCISMKGHNYRNYSELW